MKLLETIKFEVYRGKHEPVTSIQIAEVRIFKSHVEILLSYDYEYDIPDVMNIDTNATITIKDICRLRAMLQKEHLSISESIMYHQDDKEREYPIHFVAIEKNGKSSDVILRSTKEDSDNIYKKLKQWLLANNT